MRMYDEKKLKLYIAIHQYKLFNKILSLIKFCLNIVAVVENYDDTDIICNILCKPLSILNYIPIAMFFFYLHIKQYDGYLLP